MPDVGRVFKEESTRLARKEVRTAVSPVKTQIRHLRRGIADLKTQLARLEKSIIQVAKKSDDNSLSTDDADNVSIRVSPASIKKHRIRLQLSQAQMAKLLGVSSITILNWEQGKSKPRAGSKEAIAELRTMGIKDVKIMLDGLA